MGISKEGDLGDDMSDMGAIALITGFIKQLWKHRGLYLGILVLIVLPLVAVQGVIFFLIGLNAIKQDFVQKLAAGDLTDVEVEPGMIVRIAAMVFASALFQTVFMAIQYIPIVYTAASLITNKTVDLAEAARAVGRLWKPVILTSLAYFTAGYGLQAIAVPIMYACYLRSSIALMVLVGLLNFALVLFISFAFQMGLIVPVLEGVYGWKALGRSWKLLQGKRWVAFRMIILLALLVTFIALLLQFFFQLVLMLFGISNASIAGSVLALVRSTIFVSVETVLVVGTETFLYSSCRDLHQESITDSAFFQAQVMALKGGYETISQHPEKYDVESLNTPES